MSRRGWASRGYTVVEVLVGISLLIIASSGIVALQKVASQGNGHARELAVASQVARTWVERLRTDATRWNASPVTGTPSDIGQTVWLNQVNAAPQTWFRPAFNAVLGSPGADVHGNDVPLAELNNAFYCTHVRMSWMFPEEVIRADVRVVWQRAGGLGGFDNQGVCADAQVIANFSNPVAQPLSRYHFVYLSSSISRNKAQLP
jgi:type II secretory pathway pseudopilin PulG